MEMDDTEKILTYEIFQLFEEKRLALGMTLTEFKLWLYFISRKGQVLDRTKLKKIIQKEGFIGERTIDVYIYRLNTILGKKTIRSINREGYVYYGDEIIGGQDKGDEDKKQKN